MTNCAGAGGSPNNALSIDGSLAGPSIPSSGKVIVIWPLSDSPEIIYKFGEGTSSGSQFHVTFNSEPPFRDIASCGAAIGLVLLVSSTEQVPDGQLPAEYLATLQTLGMSNETVIWRTQCVSCLSWSQAFPVGYGCGRCAPPIAGSWFDSYQPIDCSLVQLQTDPLTIADCNWT
jgi:hypothetical protein